ncbi:hypothetical protein Tco_0736237 [Tanacetum coccineum]
MVGDWWCRCGESGKDGGDVIKVTRWWWLGDDDGVGDGSSGGCHGGVAAGWREVAERWPEVMWCISGWSRGGSGLDRAGGVMEVAARVGRNY